MCLALLKNVIVVTVVDVNSPSWFVAGPSAVEVVRESASVAMVSVCTSVGTSSVRALARVKLGSRVGTEFVTLIDVRMCTFRGILGTVSFCAVGSVVAAVSCVVLETVLVLSDISTAVVECILLIFVCVFCNFFLRLRFLNLLGILPVVAVVVVIVIVAGVVVCCLSSVTVVF